MIFRYNPIPIVNGEIPSERYPTDKTLSNYHPHLLVNEKPAYLELREVGAPPDDWYDLFEAGGAGFEGVGAYADGGCRHGY